MVDEAKKTCSTNNRVILIIKAALKAAAELCSALLYVNSSLLRMEGSTIWNPALLLLTEVINAVIMEEATDFRDLETISSQGLFTVKSGLNSKLDTEHQSLLELKLKIEACCVFIHRAGSRLDRGLDKSNIRILPLAAYDLEEVRSLLAIWTLTFQECIARGRKTPFDRCLTVGWGLLVLLLVEEISHSVIPEDGGVICMYDTNER